MISILETNELIKWLIINVVCETLFASLDVFLFTSLFGIKTTNTAKWKVIPIYGIIRTLFLVLIPTPFNRMCNLLVAIVLFYFIFERKIENCILGEVINSITFIITETIFAKLCCFLMPSVDTYAMGIYNTTYVAALKISVFVGRLLICHIIKARKIIIKISDNLSKKNRNNIIIVSILEYIIIFFNEAEMTMYIADFPYSIFILDMLSIIICFYISMKAILRMSILEEQDLKIHELTSYNKTLSIMYDSIRGFRHDFSNFIQALDGYVKVNNIEGIKKMSSAIVQECKTVNNMAILDPKIINNPAAYSMITNKYYLAQENNVNMNIEVMTDLSSAEKCNYEFCRILGILLDNAIEASKKTKKKIVNVLISEDQKLKRKLIKIENTYDTSFDIDMDKLFDKGYTSKNDTKNEHGLGLWTVKRILEKNHKLDLYTNKGEMFCQQLEIYE